MLRTRKALKDLQAARKALFRAGYAERNAGREADAALKRIEECRTELEVALTEELAELDKQLDVYADIDRRYDEAMESGDIHLADKVDDERDEARRLIIGGLR